MLDGTLKIQPYKAASGQTFYETLGYCKKLDAWFVEGQTWEDLEAVKKYIEAKNDMLKLNYKIMTIKKANELAKDDPRPEVAFCYYLLNDYPKLKKELKSNIRIFNDSRDYVELFTRLNSLLEGSDKDVKKELRLLEFDYLYGFEGH